MKIFSKTSKVKRNIMTIMWIFAVVTIVVLWFFQFVIMRNLYAPIQKYSIEYAADNVAEALGTDELESVVENVSVQNSMSVRVLSANGLDVFPEYQSLEGYIYNLDASDIQYLYGQAIRNGGEYTEKKQEKVNETIYVRIVNTPFQQYMILISSSFKSLAGMSETLKIQFVFLGFGVLGLAWMLTRSLSQTISEPLTRLNEQAKRLAKGDYSVKFDGEGFVEAEELSDTLNYATQELQKLDKLKDELIANISHDLRTPLTLITGYGEVMRDIPGENTPENIQVIIDEAKHLSEIVNELLDLSKLRSGEIPLVKESFDITVFLKRIFDRYDRLTELEGYDIVFDDQVGRNVLVYADVIQIERVVSNLINNAINYTGEDKKVILRQFLKEQNGQKVVRVEVADTGKGISQKDIEHIWDRYYRSNDEHKRANIGSGLGLSIVKVLLDLHEAKFGVTSSSDGSVFWFELNCE